MTRSALLLFDGFIETPLSAGFRDSYVRRGALAAGMSLWQSRVLARRWGFAICGMRHPVRRGRLVGGDIPCWP